MYSVATKQSRPTNKNLKFSKIFAFIRTFGYLTIFYTNNFVNLMNLMFLIRIDNVVTTKLLHYQAGLNF